MPDRSVHRLRGGPTCWVLPALLALVSACATNAEGGTTPSIPVVATSTTSSTVAVTPATAAPTTRVPIDPAALLAESLAASSANYRFTSVVLVGEQTLTTITGNVDGNAVAAEIATGSGEVSYVRTAEGEWVTGPDGDWVELEGKPPVEPPLASLVDAGNLVLESGDGSQGVFTGTLGAAAGPAQGIPFSLTVENGVVSEIRYQVDTGGEMAQVITTLTEIGAAGGVTAPEGV